MAVVVKISELKIGDVVSWQHHGNTVAPVVEGTVIGFSGGMGLRAPEAALLGHSNTFPAIPLGDVIVPDDYTKYDYIVVRKQTGVTGDPEPQPIYEIREIGIPWIIPSSVTRQYRQVLTITVEDFDDELLPALKQFFRRNGLNKATFVVNGEV